MGGYPDNGKQAEILDQTGQPKKCTSVKNFPTDLRHAFGGLLNNQVVICGGLTGSYTNKCQRLGNNGQWSPFGAGLQVARFNGGSATVKIQGEDYLWMTGGQVSSDNYLKSTELLSSFGTVTSGKDLPEKSAGHCMVVINNYVMVIGGVPESDVKRSDVIIFDSSNDFSHEYGPSLITRRGGHACSTMVSPAHGGRTVVVVAGSSSGDGSVTAEILDYTMSGSTWQQSEYLLFIFVNYTFLSAMYLQLHF